MKPVAGKTIEEAGAVILGASCGALCRWFTVDSSYFRTKPFLGILCMNGIGSLILGTVVGYQSMRALKPHLSLL
jgi:fluoride ion exporter CrcB/FEX